jgi:hypothetical protein
MRNAEWPLSLANTQICGAFARKRAGREDVDSDCHFGDFFFLQRFERMRNEGLNQSKLQQLTAPLAATILKK